MAALAAATLLVLAVLGKLAVQARRAGEFKARTAMPTDEFVAALPMAGRDRNYRLIARAVRAAVAAHTRLPEESIYPTDLMGVLGSVRGSLSSRSLRRGMEAHLGKPISARGTDALRPRADQSLASYINQVAASSEVVE